MSKKTNLDAVFKEVADKHEEKFEVNDWLDFQNHLQTEGVVSSSSGNSIINGLQQFGSFLAKNFVVLTVVVTTVIVPISQSSIFESQKEIDNSISNIETKTTSTKKSNSEKKNIDSKQEEIIADIDEKSSESQYINANIDNLSNQKRSNISGKKYKIKTNKTNLNYTKPKEPNPSKVFNNTQPQKTNIENEKKGSFEEEKIETTISNKTKKDKNLAKKDKKALRKQKKEEKKKEREKKKKDKENRTDDGDYQYLFKKKK